MASPEVYIGHASPADDAVCRDLVAALRGAGVQQFHYEQFTPATGTLTVVVVGELRARPINLYLLSPAALASPIVRQFAEGEHKRIQGEPLRILLPVVVAPFAETDLWPFLRSYPRIEAAPGKPYSNADAIRHTLETLALAAAPSGLRGLFSGKFTPNPLTYAKALHWKGSDADALAELQRLTQQQPQSFDAWYALAALQDDRKQSQAALASYDRALAINAEQPHAWVKKGYLLDMLGQYDAGVAACDRAIALDANLSSAWYTKGYILDDLNRLDEALAAYQRSLELEPDMAVGWSNMGITLRKMQRLDEARSAQTRAIELDPNFAPAHLNLANVLMDLKEFEGALSEAEKAIALDATNPVFWYTKGRALVGLRRYPEALVALQRFPTFQPARGLAAQVDAAMRG
jgi:tetratricopeptide (TPR) repeat protein